MGVDDRGNGVVVDVTVSALEDLDRSDTLLLGLVCQHGSESSISDTLDSLDTGVELVVNDDPSLVVHLDTNILEPEVLGDGSSTDSDEDDVSIEGLGLATLGSLDVKEDLAVLLLGTNDLGVDLELESLLGQDLLEVLAARDSGNQLRAPGFW